MGRRGQAVSAQGSNRCGCAHARRTRTRCPVLECRVAVMMMSLLMLLQQKPIIVEVGKQPTPTRDVTFDFLLGMFAMAGLFLLAALIGSALVAAGIIIYKRRHSSTDTGQHDHTTLRI